MTGESSSGPRLRGGKGPAVLPGTGWTAPIVTFAAATMAFLAVLTLAAAMAADMLAAQWRADLAGIATVRIIGTEDEIAEKLPPVLEILRTTPGIRQVWVLSDEEQQALVAPWLGERVDLADLPAPRLIDVELDEAGPDTEALQGRLDLTVSGVIYDDHAAWRAPLVSAARGLERLALIATLLILLTAAGMIAFAARATLSANRQVIETLRLVGAEDGFIANAFVQRLAVRAAIGGLIGAITGGIAIALLPSVKGSDSVLGIALSPDLTGWLMLLIGVPLAGGLVTWVAARSAVRITLKRMP